MKLELCSALLCATSAVSASFLPNVAFTEKKKTVHRMNFNVRSGKSYRESEAGLKPRFVKRSDTHEVEIENESSFYLIDLGMGSQNSTVGVLLDTGSSDLWVMSPDNPYCESSSSSDKSVVNKLKQGKSLPGHKKASGGSGGNGGPPDAATTTDDNIATEVTTVSSSEATIDCSEYGTFDNSDSSSFVSNDTEFLIQYADYTYAYGIWGYDDVSVGDSFTVTDLSFAVANSSNSSIGVLGIGLSGSETTYSGSLGTNYEYENLPLKMVSQGLIQTAAYSLYLDSTDASSGTVLFGGVDHDKYSGTLGLLPIINTLESSGYNTAIRLEVTLSGVYIPMSDGDDTAVITTTLAPALLDSGTTLTYVPEAIMVKIGEAFGATYSSSVGAYIMDCVDSSNTSVVEFDFSGAFISVPLYDLQVEVTTSGGGSTSYCAIGTLSSGDDSYIMGASFLRSAYVVYDLENKQIAIAQSNQGSDSEDIEAISSSIPSASSVSGYSETWSTDVYDTATALTYTTGTVGNSSYTSSSSSSTSKKSDANKLKIGIVSLFAVVSATFASIVL